MVRLRHSKVHAEDGERCETGQTRMDQLDREITLVGPLDEDQRARLLEIANRCPVHRSLNTDVRITTELSDDAVVRTTGA